MFREEIDTKQWTNDVERIYYRHLRRSDLQENNANAKNEEASGIVEMQMDFPEQMCRKQRYTKKFSNETNPPN